MENIRDPLVHAKVMWVTVGMGGRSSGPPSAPVYTATSVLVHGGDAAVHPGWPLGADQLSILVQMTATLPDGAWLCKLRDHGCSRTRGSQQKMTGINGTL
jgi:hypothetical protein